MKFWQHGIRISRLKNYGHLYDAYNLSMISPFLQVTKNNIADFINKNIFYKKQLGIREGWIGTGSSFVTNISKSSTTIYMANSRRVAIAYRKKGDRVITKMGYREPADLLDVGVDTSHISIIRQLEKYQEPTFLYVREGHYMDEMIADFSGFQKIGMKISSFGDLTGVWFRTGELEPIPRTFPKIDSTELITIKKVKIPDVSKLCEKLEKRLMSFDEEFTNHYSNYNEKNTWSAISLRGYRRDWRFITKPSEMSRKWTEENKDKIFRLQNTRLRSMFPEVEKLIKYLPSKIHRIRFMNLSGNTGELSRHTDLVDKGLGVEDGMLMRFHFPIKTNRKVMFSCWGQFSKETRRHMKVGSCYYLDIRKPHSAVNNGHQVRTHLVVDVVSSPVIRKLLSQ
jgi:hypothetical protein